MDIIEILGNNLKNKDFLGAFAITGYKALWVLDECLDKVQPHELYELILNFYSNTEIRSKRLKKYILLAKDCKPKGYKLDDNISIDNQGYVKVYCSSCNIKEQISWTISKEIAAKFQIRHEAMKRNSYMYEGRIEAENIIAYLNNREEKEIVQLNSVVDIMQLN